MPLWKKMPLSRFNKLAYRIRRPRVGIALSGGGCRAFYGLGLFSRLQEMGLKAQVWGGSSAGSSMALGLALNRTEEVIRIFTALTAINEKNLYLSKLIRGKRPFPHEEMYRTTIRKILDWQEFQNKVEEFIIPVTYVPPEKISGLQNNMRVFYDLAMAYRHDLNRREQGKADYLLKQKARYYGLQEIVFSKKDIRDPQHLEDLILATSSVPPLVRFQEIQGKRYLDGGIYNHMPIAQLTNVDYRLGVVYEKNDLINYRKALRRDNTYIFYPPKEEVTISVWEYSRPDLIEETFELGRRDAEYAKDSIGFLLP
jgi:predicted acylesterase/phospholipase RssA